MRKLLALTILILCWSHAAQALPAGGTCPTSVTSAYADITQCFYIDASGGSDSNNGTTESTPWLHAPGMQGTVYNVGPGQIDIANGSGPPNCGNATCDLSSYGFIFKGGVTVPHTFYEWTMREKGTASNHRIYFGVDPVWYTGGSWTRPIFDYGGSAGGYKCSPALQEAPTSYTIWDNFEWTNLYWDSTCNGGGNGKETYMDAGGGVGEEITHMYFHNWQHQASSAADDACTLLQGGTGGGALGASVHDSIFDGTDTQQDSCQAVNGAPNIFYNNICLYLVTCYIGDTSGQYTDFHQNTVLYTQQDYGSSHSNCFESNFDDGVLMYNNVFLHAVAGYCVAYATTVGHTSYFFNNVWGDVDPDENLVMDANQENVANSTYIFNNTIENGHDPGTPAGNIGCTVNAIVCQYTNNVIITSLTSCYFVVAGTGACPSSNSVDTNNLIISLASFNTDGYNIGSTYAFAPPTSGGTLVTVGGGTNLTANATYGCAVMKLVSACTDAGYGVIYNTGNHTVSVPKRTPLSRPTSAAWDKGAFQVGVGTVTLSPSSQAFGTIPVGVSSSPFTFTASNANVTTATSLSFSLSGPNSAEYSISNTGVGSCSAASNAIAMGVSCTITVTLTPSGTGSRTATLTMTYSGGDLASPQTTALSGTGASAMNGTQIPQGTKLILGSTVN